MNTLPKIFAKENPYPAAFMMQRCMSNGINGIPNPMAAGGFLPNYITVPDNVVIQSNGEMGSILQSHRRKLLRRAANRRSAQLSRARKKNFMEELKNENLRLQKIADMLDSQPDLLFCVNAEGQITYISERTKNYVKTDESCDEDPSHMNQILTTESMDILIETLNQLKMTSMDYSSISPVKEICYHDANGYPTVGYLRCSKIVRRKALEEEGGDSDSNQQTPTQEPTTKKSKKNIDTELSKSNLASAIELSNMKTVDMTDAIVGADVSQKSLKEKSYSSNSSSGSEGRHKHKSFNSGNSDSNRSDDSNGKTDNDKTDNGQQNSVNSDDQEDEFICTIRPADVSIPQGASVQFQTYLSTASMVEHDRKIDLNARATHAHTHTNTTINLTESNRGSPSCSLSGDSGSDDKFGSTGDSGSGQSSGNQVGTETESEESDSA